MEIEAETTVVLRLSLREAELVAKGIRQIHRAWQNGLSEEDANRPEEECVRYVRILPNNIAMAVARVREDSTVLAKLD